jgi:hypothetical protein
MDIQTDFRHEKITNHDSLRNKDLFKAVEVIVGKLETSGARSPIKKTSFAYSASITRANDYHKHLAKLLKLAGVGTLENYTGTSPNIASLVKILIKSFYEDSTYKGLASHRNTIKDYKIT